jgi:MerR family transcriptional regulator, light-induced transcriptional regulator
MSPPNNDKDAQYSMRVVTRLTGLSPDTIRAWERRYDAVVPDRTDGNTRRYSAEDVRRLALLKEATHRGYRIGDIARLGEEELRGLTDAEEALAIEDESEDPSKASNAFIKVRRAFFSAIERFDARTSSDILSRAAAIFRPRDLILEVVLPIMRETGDRWHGGELTVSHEHLVSMQARSLLDAILRLSSPHQGAPRIITATPEGQMHEFGALAGAMLAALRGFDVLYLGPQVPSADLKNAIEISSANVLLLSVVLALTPKPTRSLAEEINSLAIDAAVWVGVGEDNPLTSRLEGARVLHSFDDLDIALTQLLS